MNLVRWSLPCEDAEEEDAADGSEACDGCEVLETCCCDAIGAAEVEGV